MRIDLRGGTSLELSQWWEKIKEHSFEHINSDKLRSIMPKSCPPAY